MAYRGENINITIKGDSEFNLDNLDFEVLVYPDRHTDEVTTLSKSSMTKVGANTYFGTIEFSETKTMYLGFYTIEVLIKESETSRSIYVKPSAFPVYDSASKDIK